MTETENQETEKVAPEKADIEKAFDHLEFTLADFLGQLEHMLQMLERTTDKLDPVYASDLRRHLERLRRRLQDPDA